MSHGCYAHGCSERISDQLLMCGPHWRRVPADLQRAVWRTWRAVQETGSLTHEYLEACDAARAALVQDDLARANRRAGKTWSAERWPIGTPVIVRKDDGRLFETATRSDPWQLGDGSWVIKVDGIAGGYALERVSVSARAVEAPDVSTRRFGSRFP